MRKATHRPKFKTPQAEIGSQAPDIHPRRQVMWLLLPATACNEERVALQLEDSSYWHAKTVLTVWGSPGRRGFPFSPFDRFVSHAASSGGCPLLPHAEQLQGLRT